MRTTGSAKTIEDMKAHRELAALRAYVVGVNQMYLSGDINEGYIENKGAELIRCYNITADDETENNHE